MNKNLSIFILLIIFGFGALNIANAQDTIKGYSLAPSFHNIQIKPGDQIETASLLTNHESTTANVSVRYTNAQFSVNPQERYQITDNLPIKANEWLKPSDTNPTVINPGETVTFKHQINIPANIEAGGYYPMIIYVLETESSNTQLANKIELGSILYLDVKNVENQSLVRTTEILEFEPEKNITLFPEMNFAFRARNNSKLHYKFVSHISIIDPSGKITANVSSFNNDFLYLTPNQILDNKFTWKDNSQKLFPQMGKYTAQLDIHVLDRPSEDSQSKIEFYVLPYQYLVIIALAIALIVFVAARKSIRKHRRKFQEV